MSDDRVWLHRVGAGLIDDPCSYRCAGDMTCKRTTGYQPDKTATGMRRLTVRESKELGALFGQPVGSYVCELHAPRHCRFCGNVIPWFDGSVCDWCDRYTDEDGGMDLSHADGSSGDPND